MCKLSKKSVALMFSGALLMLLLIWGSYQSIHYTSKTEFCLSCHSMSTVAAEYQQSIHFKNASGVRAECQDCHIPPGIIPTLVRKTQAVSELYYQWISPSINTPEKFEAKRLELAHKEWLRMTESNSAACKSCHSYQAMDHGRQSSSAAQQMSTAAGKDSQCIDCHKGIAHRKPDTSSGFRDDFKKLEQQAQQLPESKELFTLTDKKITASANGEAGKAQLMPATKVTVLASQDQQIQIEITGWRENSGRGRVITQYPGKRVFSAVLDDSLLPAVKVLTQQQDTVSNQQWEQISVTAWTSREGFSSSLQPVWQYAESMLKSTCSSCHSTPPTTQYNANGWIAGLKAMSTYYRLSKQEESTLLKYLQTHASDTRE
ncbi:NapC/NirT family cytochrome c [Jinshanibacter sp. LJY008]|uniref:Cytochrome c-type protein n=1 Tax=Limnobaculum eriocheiris TaxID=2897391 RepID=A0A9X1SJT6_9GAMM|nr:NapC/NirT family cytochrome c [Limnobaculum eriocheiris]MCD1125226.1 NapC/NirT family cytochrome c [Limnobaculum eriocheiris]